MSGHTSQVSTLIRQVRVFPSALVFVHNFIIFFSVVHCLCNVMLIYSFKHGGPCFVLFLFVNTWPKFNIGFSVDLVFATWVICDNFHIVHSILQDFFSILGDEFDQRRIWHLVKDRMEFFRKTADGFLDLYWVLNTQLLIFSYHSKISNKSGGWNKYRFTLVVVIGNWLKF